MVQVRSRKATGRSKAGGAAQPLAKAGRTREAGALRVPNVSEFAFLNIYRASPLERIEMIRRGVPAQVAKGYFSDLPIGHGVGLKALSLSAATVNKKAKHGDTLSAGESERVVGFARLVGQLEAMIQESGQPDGFDARAWMARWLTEPLPAFGGARPVDWMDTMEGQGLVSGALARMQSGSYG